MGTTPPEPVNLNNEQLHQPEQGHRLGIPLASRLVQLKVLVTNHGKTPPLPEVSASCHTHLPVEIFKHHNQNATKTNKT